MRFVGGLCLVRNRTVRGSNAEWVWGVRGKVREGA